MSKSIFIFRRDFRISDNLGLKKILETYKNIKIIPIFILDPYQIKKTNNNKFYHSNNAIQFMIESLKDLNIQLNNKLNIYYGKPWIIIDKLLKNDKNIINVGFNGDFSEYSLIRDKKIKEVCVKYGVKMTICNDDLILLQEEEMLKENGIPYIVFSVFYKKCKHKKIIKNKKIPPKKFIKNNSKNKYTGNLNKFYNKNDNILVNGGRKNAIKILKNLNKFKDYNNNRDYLDYNTTHLSAYLKFGCVSIRECYICIKKYLGPRNELLKQLYWRSYYVLISKHVRNKYNSFIDTRFNKIKWQNNPNKIKYWKALWTGNTGFLIIDASVRELNKTGFMHNRGRLLVGNFSIKILRLNPFDLKWGGQVYFSKLLTDGSYEQNLGNWSWVATDTVDGSGKRYGKGLSGRIFDPRQLKKWDENCNYVKKWLPKLKNIKCEHINNWNKYHKLYNNLHVGPIVDYEKRKKEWINLTKNIK
jgi:deoxyribodipyrimidine photo-lyase